MSLWRKWRWASEYLSARDPFLNSSSTCYSANKKELCRFGQSPPPPPPQTTPKDANRFRVTMMPALCSRPPFSNGPLHHDWLWMWQRALNTWDECEGKWVAVSFDRFVQPFNTHSFIVITCMPFDEPSRDSARERRYFLSFPHFFPFPLTEHRKKEGRWWGKLHLAMRVYFYVFLSSFACIVHFRRKYHYCVECRYSGKGGWSWSPSWALRERGGVRKS